MQNFTADSMVLKSEAKSYSTIVNFGNEGLQAAADLPNIMNITTKLKTPNFPDHALLF